MHEAKQLGACAATRRFCRDYGPSIGWPCG